MDERRRLSASKGRAPAGLPWSSDVSAELWHSTPVKQRTGEAPLHGSQPSVFKMPPADAPSPPNLWDIEFPGDDLTGSTVQRQRRELQLLMAELKDRDKELNITAASHQKQLHAWEQDRQKLLALGQKCARLHDELQKRNEVIRVLTRRVWVVETREREVRTDLSAAQKQLCGLEQKQQQACQDYEEKNQSLNSKVMILSAQVCSLQVKEEQLSAKLRLKDQDVTEASTRILDLAGRLRDLEASLMESRSRESKALRDLEENKRRYREAKHDVTHLKEELQQQLTQSSSQREEMIRLKQELQLLRRDLVLSGEGDGWKDELLDLARSKQERTVSELRCLRQVCENQRNDLQLLQLNLESARETLREKSSQGTLGSQGELSCGCVDVPSSSIRVKTSNVHEMSPAAETLCSTAAGDDLLSSCFLQQLLDESRLVVSGSDHQKCPTPHHHHPNPPTHKLSEAAPTSRPRHDPTRPCRLHDTD